MKRNKTLLLPFLIIGIFITADALFATTFEDKPFIDVNDQDSEHSEYTDTEDDENNPFNRCMNVCALPLFSQGQQFLQGQFEKFFKFKRRMDELNELKRLLHSAEENGCLAKRNDSLKEYINHQDRLLHQEKLRWEPPNRFRKDEPPKPNGELIKSIKKELRKCRYRCSESLTRANKFIIQYYRMKETYELKYNLPADLNEGHFKKLQSEYLDLKGKKKGTHLPTIEE